MRGMEILLRKAETADIEVIHRLAVSIWNDHYPAIIGQKQVDYMLGKMYSYETLNEQIKEKKQQFYLIESIEEALGFVAVELQKDETLFLNKFYILSNIQKRGFGAQAFKELLKLYPTIEKVTLQVNRQNYKAINFYFKQGFTIEEVADFDIGNGYFMNDFMMVFRRQSTNEPR